MPEQKQIRTAGALGNGNAYPNQNRRKMLIALALLLAALIVMLARNSQVLSGTDESAPSDETTTAWVPRSFTPAPKVTTPAPATPATAPKKHVGATKTATPVPTPETPAVVATKRTVMPPLEIEVVAGAKQNGFRSNSNSQSNQISSVAPGSAEWGPATNAVEQVRTYSQAPAVLQPTNVSYPLLAQQMKVQGAVLLQAMISGDGVIRDVRVLSGPAILASAAREAALQWKFKPYLVNGKPVETTAKITVNFTIKVLDNVIKDQPVPVVAMSRSGNS
jgi:periplasmic protein TonB